MLEKAVRVAQGADVVAASFGVSFNMERSSGPNSLSRISFIV
jgi:hypothetical protein